MRINIFLGVSMVNIHWLGTGLSAIPGLKMLIENGHSVIVYNRTVEKALEALSDVKGDYQVFAFSIKSVEQNVTAGDIVVSMLPGNFHVPIAELCLSVNAHFVSSSYISDEMRALNSAAREKICVLLTRLDSILGLIIACPMLWLRTTKIRLNFQQKMNTLF